ncbi:hypothetical protein MRX96_057217 [Rhipicephalus microplus]
MRSPGTGQRRRKLWCRVGGRTALKISARGDWLLGIRRSLGSDAGQKMRRAAAGTVSGEGGEVIEPRASCSINREYTTSRFRFRRRIRPFLPQPLRQVSLADEKFLVAASSATLRWVAVA